MSIYSQVKDQVTTRDVAEFYGHSVSRSGMMVCPFHPDKNPSMKVDENFICFGCGARGDVIRFTEKLFGLDPYDAACKIIQDMALNISTDSRAIRRPIRRIKRVSEKDLLLKAVNHVYSVYCVYFRLLNRWLKVYAPRSPTEEPDPRFLEAVNNIDSVEYLLDTLLYGNNEDKAVALIEMRKEVQDLERRINGYGSKDPERLKRSDSIDTSADERE